MPMEMDGRVPPHSDDAEKSLLGAMMLSREAVMMAVETLQSDDFYSAVNKALFEAMCALYAAGRPVDLVTMTDELNSLCQHGAVLHQRGDGVEVDDAGHQERAEHGRTAYNNQNGREITEFTHEKGDTSLSCGKKY